jgi:hypothetical protein
MPLQSFDRHAIDDLARSQGGIVTHAQLVTMGMSPSTISRWTRTGGHWQRLLPATYLVHRGTPTFDERLNAALLYAGPQSVTTGLGALHLYGIRNLPTSPPGLPLHVLLPHQRHARSVAFLTVERTHRLPDPLARDGYPVVPIARALFDAGRRLDNRHVVRAFTLEAVQRRLTTVSELRDEITDGQRQWTAVLRDVVGDATAGVMSNPEAGLRDLVVRSDLHEPLWNPRLETPDGDLIAEPDGYYEDLGIALEVDSRKHHFDDEDGYETTWQRHKRFARLGIPVLRIMPVDIRDQPAQVIDDIKATRAAHAGRVAPEIVVKPWKPTSKPSG